MIDGTADGYEPYEEAVGRQPTTKVADESEGATCSTARAPPDGPRA
jgi:hypothetical protein